MVLLLYQSLVRGSVNLDNYRCQQLTQKLTDSGNGDNDTVLEGELLIAVQVGHHSMRVQSEPFGSQWRKRTVPRLHALRDGRSTIGNGHMLRAISARPM